MSVKIADVAKRANVGAGTVSRVLNGSKSVSDETRERVLACISELGYTPNLVARGLAANRTGVVGAVIPVVGYTQHAEVIQGLSDMLYENGLQLMIGQSGYSQQREEHIVRNFLERRPEAFYVTGAWHTAETRQLLRESGVPVVECSSLTDDPIDTVVGYDNFEGARRIARLLQTRGYRNLAIVTSTNDANDRTQRRLDGYLATCVGLGASPADIVLPCENTFAGGAEAVGQALLLSPPVDLLLCVTDVIAVGALFECQRRGISVPQQIGISGFDDLPIASSINPSLTTVSVDRVGMGRRAAETLLRRIEGSQPARSIVDVGFQIKERASTRA